MGGRAFFMAGDWMPIRLDLPDDPAVLTLSDELGLEPDAVVGKLIRLWAWGQKHVSANGHADVTPMSLERVVSCAGFANALVNVGWLEHEKNSIKLLHWDRWNSQSAKKRLQDTRRKQLSRTGQSADRNATTGEKRRVQKSTSKKETPVVPLALSLQTEWNEVAIAVGLPLLRKAPGKKALRDFKARMGDFAASECDFWEEAREECRHLTAFARGKVASSDGRFWKITFGYVVTAAGAEKLLQGGWRAEPGDGQFTPQKGSPMAVMDEFNVMQDEIDRRNAQ